MDRLEGVTEVENGRIGALLEEYSDVFSASEFDLGRTPLM